MHGLPLNTSVAEVVLRLARPEERLTWDRLMAERHELGFLRLEGRGQRSVAGPVDRSCGRIGFRWRGLAGKRAVVRSAGPVDRLEAFGSQQYELVAPCGEQYTPAVASGTVRLPESG